MTHPLLPAATDHPDRRPLTDELHARPFAPVIAPATIAFVAVALDGSSRGRGDAHLLDLLDHLGVEDTPDPTVNHRVWEREGFRLRWERHTEFISYTLSVPGAPDEPFDPRNVNLFPRAWLSSAPGGVIAAVLMQVEVAEDAEAAERAARDRFAPVMAAESLAAAWLAGRQAVALSDFRIDANGFTRFGVIGVRGVGPRRLGRLAQRLTELETYRILSMRALPVARRLSPELAEIDRALADMVAGIGRGETDARHDPARERAMLDALTAISAKLERMSAESAFRFGASRAYEALVAERLQVIREERMLERQTFSEFMVRRYRPAMRTVRSVEERLVALATRSERAANLLRTRVDVTLEAQNQALLESMNRRAELQLRLQQTVEGLSVVAISYYAVSLAGYLLAPFAEPLGVSLKLLNAAVAPPIIASVYIFVRRLRRAAEKR